MNIYDTYEAHEIAKEAAKKQKTSGVLWIAIGIIQVLGVLSRTPYGIATMVIGIFNIVTGIRKIKTSGKLKTRENTIPGAYEKQLKAIIFSMIFNLVFGVVGILACLYDLHLRQYILQNKWAFNLSKEDVDLWLEKQEALKAIKGRTNRRS